MLAHESPMSQSTRPTPRSGQAPSLLAVTSELPWPLDTGGHLRTFHLLRTLAGRFRVRLVTAVTVGQDEGVEILRRHGVAAFPASVAPRNLVGEALRVTAAAAKREPYVLYRRHDRSAVRAGLREQIERE